MGILLRGKGVIKGKRDIKHSAIKRGSFISCFKNISIERRKKP